MSKKKDILCAAHIRIKTQNQLLPVLISKKLEITAPVGKKTELKLEGLVYMSTPLFSKN